ncbi:MAG: hypothetical protein ACI8T1_002629 [Verrucomicrobiales bacterium]|jgi:hypothetical protein
MECSNMNPPTEAAREYLATREASMAIISKLMAMKGSVHPLTAARALGISISGKTVCFDGDWELSLLSEYSLFYHVSKGKRLFQRALEETDNLTPVERYILESNQKAFASVFEIKGTRPDLWEVDLRDLLGARGTVTIIDRNFSQSLDERGMIHARLVPFDLFTSSSGAILPLLTSDNDEATKAKVLRHCRQAIEIPSKRTRQHALLYSCRKLHMQFGPEVRYD